MTFIVLWGLSMDRQFEEQRLARLKELIVIYEDALAALAGGAQSYTLDTGQTKQTVTRANLASLQASYDSLYNRYTTLRARLNGDGQVIGRPAW